MSRLANQPRNRDRFAALWSIQDLAQRTAQMDAHATLRPPPSSEDATLARRVAALPKLTRPADDAPPELALGPTIGEGGMGIVRSAHQLALGREVAVKSLRPGQVSPESVRKLLHEALITGSLEHPDIIPVYALGQGEDGSPMMVMKRVEGTAWSAVLRDPEHPLLQNDPRERIVWHLEVLMRVCHAMAYAHGKGILHRDLKPENVMVGRFGEVYVLDWGIAVSLHDDRTGALPLARDAKVLAGTPSCMAPEMVEGDGERLDVRSDVFLLGAVLHQIVTGQSRFTGESVYEVLFAAFQCEPHRYGPDVPEELVAICNKAMARDPEDRFATPAELRLALATYLRHRTSLRLLAGARESRREFATALAEVQALQHLTDGAMAPLEEATAAMASAFAEARLALREALRSWAENRQAIEELQALLSAYVDWQLQTGDLKGAASHLAELPEPDPALRERVTAAQAHAEKHARKIARLAADFDPRVGARTRSGLALGLAFIWSVLPWTAGVLWQDHGATVMRGRHVAATGIFAALAVSAAVWARDALARSKLNRSVVSGALVTVMGTFLARCVAWYLGVPFGAAVAFDLVIAGTVVAMMAASQWRRLFVPAAVYLAGTAVATLAPNWALESAAVAHLVAMSLIAFAWRPTDYDDCALVRTAVVPVPVRLDRNKRHRGRTGTQAHAV